MRLRSFLIRQLSLVLLLLAGWAVPGSAATSAKDYAERLRQAERATDQLIEGDPSAPEVATVMNSIKQTLPPREDVELNGQLVHADNSWLHEAIDQVIKHLNDDEEQLRSMLVEIADRLYQLEQRVSASQTQDNTVSPVQRAQLEQILARHEYLPEEKKESVLRKWINRFWDKLSSLLSRLFGGRSPSAGRYSGGTVSIFRIIMTLILLAAASFGLVKLLRRWQRKRKDDKDNSVREVLGEELADDVTAAELLIKANELARQGDFRAAIRRAYIALLCELEQRGKVRLHRAKTNRDYLDELKPEQLLYPTFSVMTGAFEHVWYGHEQATESEYSDFITLYQETVQ